MIETILKWGGITIVSISEEVLSSDEGNFTATLEHAYFCYRLQPKNGGFLLELVLHPFLLKMVLYHTGLVFLLDINFNRGLLLF